jgi:hypothetical protein
MGLWGLSILAGPELPWANSAHHQGQVIARAMGAAMLLLAVFPFGRPRQKNASSPEIPEDL